MLDKAVERREELAKLYDDEDRYVEERRNGRAHTQVLFLLKMSAD